MLEETTLRTYSKPKLFATSAGKNVTPFVFPQTCTSISRSSIHTGGVFFQGVSVSRWIGIFSSYICCLKPRFYVPFFLYAYLLGEPAIRTFLTIAFLVHTCRKHDICGYICRVSTIIPCLNTDLFICVFFEHLLLDGSCFFIHVSCFIPRIYGRCFFTSICCRKPHLEHVSNLSLSFLPHMQERESARKECRFLSLFQRHVLPFHVPVNMCRELFLGILREYI